VRKPRVNVPKATMYGTIGTAVVYVLVTLAIYGIVPNDALQDTTASLAAAATYMFGAGVGGVAGKIIAAFAVISGIGALNSWAMICGQVPQAAARDGVFPAFFNKENKFGVPYWGILSGTVLAMILVVVASMGAAGNQVYIVIVSVSSVAVGIPYFFSCLAQLYWLYTDGRRLHHPTFVKDATVAILALVVSVVMIAGAGQLSVFAGFLVILLGWIILLAMFIMKGRYGVTSFDQVGVPIDQDPKAMAAYVASQESTD
jgi:APA family basic amino acid/polyamine antiporter